MIEAAETFERESQSRQTEIDKLREYISNHTINESSYVQHRQSTESGQRPNSRPPSENIAHNLQKTDQKRQRPHSENKLNISN